MINFCDILELDFDFTETELKSAYRRLSKVYHPDANSGSTEYVEKFRMLTEAYEKLLILLKSGKYDKWKSTQQKKTQKTTTQNQNNKKESKNYAADNFSFFEFVNKEGLFEEDIHSSSENKKHHVPNDIIEVGSFSYKVTKFIFLKEFGNESIKASSDGYFIIIDLKIQNISKSMISIHNYMYRLFDNEGFFYEFSNEGLSKMHLLQEKIIPFFGKEQNPKINSNYRLIFEVPTIGDYYLQLCGGNYKFDKNNICICDRIETIKLKSNPIITNSSLTIESEIEKSDQSKKPRSKWISFWK